VLLDGPQREAIPKDLERLDDGIHALARDEKGDGLIMPPDRDRAPGLGLLEQTRELTLRTILTWSSRA
jgi:hypothetical protein